MIDIDKLLESYPGTDKAFVRVVLDHLNLLHGADEALYAEIAALTDRLILVEKNWE